MNKHIELVKKWLADPASVSQEELEDNAASAHYAAEDAGWAGRAGRAAHYAADAAHYAAEADAKSAAHWVKEYEELTDA